MKDINKTKEWHWWTEPLFLFLLFVTLVITIIGGLK